MHPLDRAQQGFVPATSGEGVGLHTGRAVQPHVILDVLVLPCHLFLLNMNYILLHGDDCSKHTTDTKLGTGFLKRPLKPRDFEAGSRARQACLPPNVICTAQQPARIDHNICSRLKQYLVPAHVDFGRGTSAPCSFQLSLALGHDLQEQRSTGGRELDTEKSIPVLTNFIRRMTSAAVVRCMRT